MTLALLYMKSGTVGSFYNVAMILSFLTDVLYFKRVTVISDYVGMACIIISTSLYGYLADLENEAKMKA